MAWERYRPTPGKNTVRYRNTETGETRSRRQQEKSTLGPQKYAQYYRKGVVKRDSRKFEKLAKTKHKEYTVRRLHDLENLLSGKRATGKNPTAFVKITNLATGKTVQTQSVYMAGDWAFNLMLMAAALYSQYFSEGRPPEDEEFDEDIDELDDEIAQGEFEIEAVFVTDL